MLFVTYDSLVILLKKQETSFFREGQKRCRTSEFLISRWSCPVSLITGVVLKLSTSYVWCR